MSRGTISDTLKTRDIGTQTDEKAVVVDIEEADNVVVEYKDNNIKDTDYVPNAELNASNINQSVDSDDTLPYHLGQKQDSEEKYFLVGENALRKLFDKCKGCGCVCRGTIKHSLEQGL